MDSFTQFLEVLFPCGAFLSLLVVCLIPSGEKLFKLFKKHNIF